MKKNIQILMLIICCCCQSKKRDYNLNLNGFWESGSIVILIKDSALMHPGYDAPGFYRFEARNDSLIISDRNETGFKDDFKCRMLPTDSDNFMLIFNNDTFKYERIKPLISKRFKKLTFEAGLCFGDCPVFKMILFSDGKLLYSGEENTKIIGDHEFKLDSQTVMETNQLLNILEIDKYPTHELSPPPDNPHINMTIEYFDGKTIEIKDGLFEGKYWNLIKYFYGFDTFIKLDDVSQNS